jgi:hypothetical protein
MEDLDINPESNAHMFFGKLAKTCNGEKTASSKMLLRKVGICL